MQEIVRSIISLIADSKIEISQDFMRSLIGEFLHNDFKIPYQHMKNVDLMDYKEIFKLLKDNEVSIEANRTKVANILALLNLSIVNKIINEKL